jgi:hypothetical protein
MEQIFYTHYVYDNKKAASFFAMSQTYHNIKYCFCTVCDEVRGTIL